MFGGSYFGGIYFAGLLGVGAPTPPTPPTPPVPPTPVTAQAGTNDANSILRSPPPAPFRSRDFRLSEQKQADRERVRLEAIAAEEAETMRMIETFLDSLPDE